AISSLLVSLCARAFSRSISLLFFSHRPGALPDLHSFPTRRSSDLRPRSPPASPRWPTAPTAAAPCASPPPAAGSSGSNPPAGRRSEEHTSELQSRFDLVCRLLLEKKNKKLKSDNS